ncbi:serine/arginine-rich SC35-like splicing factor SCL30 [Dendrobium catenatum]|uniref:Serine/arginine-rich splicing factor 33 n=1 Tax=Dendrobium catenatum TaxID=906689 RepID=A0A2I0V6G1_9ASPA|nr:serine/arginine-rich SC35-like splicing factor SCL30 [Dendrobium catenatum]XP_020703780.1 serine/arginine-rich SC35-like splicing factor SCL30 [Dendrobium catenatum]XP_020703781.1 serine/arginine-rich SC35-like splicing factor SCL30 [Dendrobium catenatum]PKU59016.1 Serine/arginine-rich splicing factor 33 [Dendrobium catenatum]
MRRYSPGYHSPPRRGYGGRGRSPPRRGYGGRRDQNQGSLLVRNIPLNCRAEELRVPFERFGPVRDVYIPKDYYSGEPRGFAFVQFVDPYDASEAQYHMNRQIFHGREITVVVASETRKRPEDMRRRTRFRAISGYDGGRSSYYGRSRSRSVSRSQSPHQPSDARMRHRSRSYSPAPKHRDDYSASPRRQPAHSRSPRGYPQGRGEKQSRRSYSPKHSDGNRKQVDREEFSASPRGKLPQQSRSSPIGYRDGHGEDRRRRSNSPESDVAGRNGATYDYKKEQRHPSYSPSGSRSRSIDSSSGRKR